VEQGAKGAILDLRDNPGGLLSEAVDVTSVYLGKGIVCRTDGLHEDPHTYNVSGLSTQPDLPLVVLVDGGSASAAEILAGAFHDNDRAVLVGERTYGKASVQTVAPLSDGGALKLTTAKYLTPAGADITGRGIEPGIVAVDDPLTERDEALRIARTTMLDVLRNG
jgi:carboxyl-terminal processing protease